MAGVGLFPVSAATKTGLMTAGAAAAPATFGASAIVAAGITFLGDFLGGLFSANEKTWEQKLTESYIERLRESRNQRAYARFMPQNQPNVNMVMAYADATMRGTADSSPDIAGPTVYGTGMTPNLLEG